MPSIVTHHLFAKDVLESLPKKTKEKISYPHYILFAQSFDNLFYYKFLTPWKGKEIRSFGEEAQKEKVNLYFKNIIKEIERQHLEKNNEVLAYLYGSMCHYVLDYHCHPLVFYHTGLSSIDKKYRGLHEKMEVNIDAYLYKKKTHKDLYKEKLANTLLPKITFSKELIHTMNEVFKNTFQKENIGNIYKESSRTGNFLLKYGVTDRTGMKKRLYKLKDALTKKSNRRYEYLSFYVKEIIPEYLNENHEEWNNPVEKDLISTKSFEDLYEEAKQKTIEIIYKIEEYFKTHTNKEELLKEIGDYSYTTGLPCDRPQTLRYFKN